MNNPLPQNNAILQGTEHTSITPASLRDLILGHYVTKQPDLNLFAEFRYTPEYSAPAVVVRGAAEDTLEIIGPGLQIVIDSPWTVPNMGRFQQNLTKKNARMFIKEHGGNGGRLDWFIDDFQVNFFPELTVASLPYFEEKGSGDAAIVMSFPVWGTRNRCGPGTWTNS